MKIEKLNEDKIRITLNIEDLKSKNVDFHSFMSNPIETQSLFLDMLDEAERTVGFTTENYRISIEALAMSNGNFIFTVTRIQEPKINKRKLHIKRKESIKEKNILIYEFETFDDFCSFCSFFNNSMIGNEKECLKNNILYYYNEKYYLIQKTEKIDQLILSCFSAVIIEFAKTILDSELMESKLKEYGKIIIKTNAIKTGIKYF